MSENLKRAELESAIDSTRKSFDTDNPTVPYIEGDGIGIDIWPAAQGVFVVSNPTKIGNAIKEVI